MKEIFEFGNFRLDVDDHAVVTLDGSKTGTLTEKSFQVLVLLVRRHGHLVTKDELIRFVWPDTIVEDNNLEKCIHHIRQFLGDSADRSEYIETVRKHGYRFVGDVQVSKVSGSWLAAAVGVPETNGIAPAAHRASSGGSMIVPAEPSDATFDAGISTAQRSQDADDKVSGGIAAGEADSAVREALGSNGISKRRLGIRRGLKACVSGIAMGFVFLVLLQTLRIGILLVYQYESGLPSGVPDALTDTARGLINLVSIPFGLGVFLGLGLLLFGVARIVWAIFDTENRKVSSKLVERIIVAFVILALLSIAIPNLMYSYRMAEKAHEVRESKTR